MHDTTPLAMVSAIANFLQENLKDMRFPSKKDIEKTVSVFEGYLPPKQNQKRGEEQVNDEYPFVIVRYLGGKNDTDSEKRIFNFTLPFGVYNEDDQYGWKDLVGLATRIEFLLLNKRFIGAGELTGEIDITIFEEQMKPTWHGIMNVNFKMRSIKQEGVFDSDWYKEKF